MRREGSEIVFDSDDQKRQFVEAINHAERTEHLIASAMKAALKLEYEARRWWAEAKKLCGEAERPAYRFYEERLVIETCEPESSYQWKPRQPAMEYLRRAKEYAVAEKEWELADAIRAVMDQKKK